MCRRYHAHFDVHASDLTRVFSIKHRADQLMVGRGALVCKGETASCLQKCWRLRGRGWLIGSTKTGAHQWVLGHLVVSSTSNAASRPKVDSDKEGALLS